MTYPPFGPLSPQQSRLKIKSQKQYRKTAFSIDNRRKHRHWKVTLTYRDGEQFSRIYIDRRKVCHAAEEISHGQKDAGHGSLRIAVGEPHMRSMLRKPQPTPDRNDRPPVHSSFRFHLSQKTYRDFIEASDVFIVARGL